MVVPEVAMHPEADALLDAIFDAPDDDTPRLVYADWLQEHGHEQYAEFIRLSIFLNRSVLRRDDRAALRLTRHLLAQQLAKSHPHAQTLLSNRNPPDGNPREWIQIEAASFLKEWRDWWPFVAPRHLTLWDCVGHEQLLGGCEYLRRAVTLYCHGTVLSGWGSWREEADWRPVAGDLLTGFVRHGHLERLRDLKVEPIQTTPDELLVFADSPAARRLHELHLWVQFPDGSREDLRAAKGRAREQIRAFVTQHAVRFAAQPA